MGKELILLGALAILTWWDVKKRALPLAAIALLGAAGAALLVWRQDFSLTGGLGGLCVGGMLLGAAYVTKEQIGRGDGAMFCALGVWLGLYQTIWLLLAASVFCAGTSVCLLLAKKWTRSAFVPFVPFVLAGYMGLLLNGAG